MKVLWILVFSLSLTSCQINTPSSGQKIGRIVKIADEGIINKTCEGELIRGGIVDGSGSMGTTFHFTIEDKRLSKIAYEAFSLQKEVIMTYECEFISSMLRSEKSHPHFVTNIEIVR